MSISPRLSATVVIPTHDHRALLQRSLASAQQQSLPDIELFVIGDGASTSSKSDVGCRPAVARRPARLRGIRAGQRLTDASNSPSDGRAASRSEIIGLRAGQSISS
jgi:hypothetical protein